MILYLKFLWDWLALSLYTVYIWARNFLFLVVPKPSKSLQNEIALVTGGASGIGREICLCLARCEKTLTVITWDVNEKQNEETAEELRKLGVRAFAHKVDISDKSQVEDAAAKIRKEIGTVTLLFNNAGIADDARPLWEQDAGRIWKIFGINILAHYWTVQAFLPRMMETGKGHVIEMSSAMGFVPTSNASAYGTTKVAVRGFAECLKLDVKRHLSRTGSVHVSVVYPLLVTTNMTATFNFRLKYNFLFSHMTSEYVASRIVSGMRANEEHIYIPRRLRFIHIFVSSFPAAVVSRALDTLFRAHAIQIAGDEIA